MKRIKLSKEDHMRSISLKTVLEGSKWGKEFLEGTHKIDGIIARRYWVQICCFPSCSCDKYFNNLFQTLFRCYYMCCRCHLAWLGLKERDVLTQTVHIIVWHRELNCVLRGG